MGTQGMQAMQAAAPSHIIKRPRLTKILDESEARIILLCAPAGYGKTTLAREWVATRKEPVLWYSGGPAMADVAALAVDLAELFAGPDSELVERVRFLASRGEEPRVLAKALARQAGETTSHFVVDDYHFAATATYADEFFRHLVDNTECPMVVASRVRPSWLDSRKVVYGDAIVIGADDLAFTNDEAYAVLPGSDDVVGQANGWPAVIGLAAIRGGEVRTGDLDPAELYDFFAADLYASAPLEVQRCLLALAVAGDVPAEVAQSLLGERSEDIIRSAILLGFVSRVATGEVVMHPLLRQFLMRAVRNLELAHRNELIARVVGVLTEHLCWDQCLAALEVAPLEATLAASLEPALPDLFDSGRTATVARWVRLARSQGCDHPIFLLAEAELAVREGRGAEGRLCAEQAAGSLTGGLAARAHLTAARGAHLSGYAHGIADHTAAAFDATTDSTLKHEALWLAFLAAYERQDARTPEHLERLCAFEGGRPDFTLRGVCARALHEFETGHVRDALATARSASQLLARVRSPLLRTNYLNLFGHILLVSAEYEEGLRIGSDQMDEARENGLGFVIGYALLLRAGAEIGLRKLRAAHRTLSEIGKRELDVDANIAANALLLAARLRIATGDLGRAAALLQQTPNTAIPPALRGEIFAYRGLVHAARMEVAEARRDFDTALLHSEYVEAWSMVTLGRAILALCESPAETEEARANVRRVLESGHRDAVITSCRAFRPLAMTCAADAQLREQLVALLAASRDIDLARAVGISIPRAMRRNDGLSRREREVLELLSEGRTNREIADTLFIGESTTKVHVRHIFEKLGVHSRAEAAAALAELD